MPILYSARLAISSMAWHAIQKYNQCSILSFSFFPIMAMLLSKVSLSLYYGHSRTKIGKPALELKKAKREMRKFIL
jgi:hypothetical protein